MKKWLIIIVSVVVVSFAALYAYQALSQPKVGPLESIVPDSAIYYIYSYNLDKKITEFKDSLFFQQVSSLPLYKKFLEPKLENIKATMPSVSDFLKKDFAVATFSVGGLKSADAAGKDFGDFLILLRADSQKFPKLKKYMADFYLSKCAKGEVSSKIYKGIKIVSRNLAQEKRQVSFAFLSQVIVLSNDIEIIQKSIDLYKNRSRDSLLNNKDFRQVTAKVRKESLLWGYQNNKNYYQQTLRAISESSSGSDAARSQAAEGLVKSPFFSKLMTIFNASAFYLDYDLSKNGLVSKTYYTLNRTGDDNDFTDIFAFNKPLDKNIYNLIPGNSIACYAINHDMPKAWKTAKQILSSFAETMKTQAKASPRYRQGMEDQYNLENALKIAEVFLGVSIEDDIIAQLGDNFGAAIVNIEDIGIPLPVPASVKGQPPQQQNFPFIFPRGFVFFELKDQAKMQETMKGIFQHIVDNVNKSIKEQEKRRKALLDSIKKPKLGQPKEEPLPVEPEKTPLTLVTGNHNGVEISRIEISDFPISTLKPNYCIIDKYLVFSLSPQLSEDIIDIYQNKKGSFGSGYNFERIQDKLPGEYANIMFFDFRKLVNNITSTKFYELQTQGLANGSQKDFSKEDLDSLIKLLKNISSLTATSNMTDSDTLESASYIEMDGL